MRTTRRGLTVIELVLILLAIGLLAFLAFRYFGRDDSPAAPGSDGVLTEAPVLSEPGDALADQLRVIAPLDSTAAPGDTVPVRVRASTTTGTGVVNAMVEFAVEEGGGSVTPASVATNDLGEAEALWVLGTGAGRQELRAAVSGRDAAAVTILLTTAADSAAGTR